MPDNSNEEIALLTIPLDKIQLNPYQPRKFFGPEELQDLCQSIVTVGLIHPPLVRPLGNDCYELISGERRLQASKLAGLSHIPVHIKSSSATLSAEMALIENIQRIDLNAIEIAKALKKLLEEFHFSQEALAQRIGKKRSTVANYLRLLTLPQNIQDSVLSSLISMGHAKAILSLSNVETQNLLHEIILRDDLSVREAEEKALRLSQKVRTKALVYTQRDFFLEELASKIQDKLGTKVRIEGKGKRGRIFIDYYNLDDLDRLIDILS